MISSPLKALRHLHPGHWLALVLLTISSTACSESNPVRQPQTAPTHVATATFAGGCFWCMEKPFDQLDGVVSTTSGYIGGHLERPTYRQISTGTTGHTEAVQVVYDPNKITYEALLKVFWVNIDPTVANRQFCDAGSQYRSGIFYHDATQQQAAEASLAPVKAKFGTVHTEITEASMFYPAEDYHQNYYQKNPIRYRYYRHGCGRDQRLEQLWGDDAPGH